MEASGKDKQNGTVLCTETRFKTDVCMIVIFKTDFDNSSFICTICERHAFSNAHMYEMSK